MTDAPNPEITFQTALDLLPQLVEELKSNWLEMFLAGLLYMALTFLMIFAILVVPYIFAIPGFALMATVYADMPEPPTWVMVCTVVPGMTAMMVAMFLVLCVGEPGMRGALLRSLDEANDEPLSWRAPTRSFRVNLRQQTATTVALSVATLLLFPLLIFPAILLALAAVLALPGAALDGLGWRDALGPSLSNARGHLGFHSGIVLILFVIGLVGGAVPFVGQAFTTVVGLAWLRIGYRHRFPRQA
jgi:hypothetical protein